MNAFVLLQEIRECLKPRLAALPLAIHGRDGRGCPLPAEDGGEPMRPCAVYLGSMPPTTNEAVSAAPFIVIQPLDGEDTAGGLQNIRVVFRLCIVAGDNEAAENDLMNLLFQLRLWLGELAGGCLEQGHFRLLPQEDGILPWERPDEQVPPFLQAHVYSVWQTQAAFKRPAPNMADYE